MSDAGAYLTAGVPAPTPTVSPTQGGFDSSGVSYTLGPFSAGQDSPLGGLFGFLNGLSNNYQAGAGLAGSDFAAGLNLAVNNPSATGYVLRADTDQQYTPAQIQAIKDAETKGLSSNPLVAVGQVLGGVFGTGVNTVGTVAGSAGGTAAPLVSQGAQQGVGGVAQVASAGVSGGFLGGIQGLGAGLSNTIAGQSGGGLFPSGVGGGGTLIFVAVVVLVIILASA